MRTARMLVAVVAFLALAVSGATARQTLDLGDGGLYGDGATLRDIQETIWFQGFLTDDATGEPINATHTVTVRIYDAPMGGSTVWGPEAHIGVPIVDGWFNIEMGSVIGGLPSFDAPPYYLHLMVNGETLLPRLKLASVPSAFQSLTADDGLTLPYSGSCSSVGVAFNVTQTGSGIGGRFEIDNAGSSAGAVYGQHNGTGPAVLAWHTGNGAAVRAVANGDGYAGKFEGAVVIEDSLRVRGLAMMERSAAVAGTLMAGQGFWFVKDPVEGYVLRCADGWGNAEWGPPNIIDVHNEYTHGVTIGSTAMQYDDAQVSLTVPGPGYIVVTSTVQVILDHTTGTPDVLILNHSTSPSDLGEYPTQVYEMIPAAYPTAPAVDRTFSIHSTHEVAGAGTHTYYLVGAMADGQDEDDVFYYAQTTGIYYPHPIPVRAGDEAVAEPVRDRESRR